MSESRNSPDVGVNLGAVDHNIPINDEQSIKRDEEQFTPVCTTNADDGFEISRDVATLNVITSFVDSTSSNFDSYTNKTVLETNLEASPPSNFSYEENNEPFSMVCENKCDTLSANSSETNSQNNDFETIEALTNDIIDDRNSENTSDPFIITAANVPNNEIRQREESNIASNANLWPKSNVLSNEIVWGKTDGAPTNEIIWGKSNNNRYRQFLENAYKARDNSNDDSSSTLSDDYNDYSDNESDETLSDTIGKHNPVHSAKYKADMTDEEDLAPIEELFISVDEDECKPIGFVLHVMKKIVVVQSLPNVPPLDMDSILFLERGQRTLGRIRETFGPVHCPYYSVHFNSEKDIRNMQVTAEQVVYCASSTEHTSYIETDLIRCGGSDASWVNNEEPPRDCLDYSDDEQERLIRSAKYGKKRAKSVKKEKVSTSEDDDKNYDNYVRRMNKKNLELTAKRMREDEAKDWLSKRSNPNQYPNATEPGSFREANFPPIPRIYPATSIPNTMSIPLYQNFSVPPPAIKNNGNPLLTQSPMSHTPRPFHSHVDRYTVLPPSTSIVPPQVPPVLPPTSWTNPLPLPMLHYTNPRVSSLNMSPSFNIISPRSEFRTPGEITRTSYPYYLPRAPFGTSYQTSFARPRPAGSFVRNVHPTNIPPPPIIPMSPQHNTFSPYLPPRNL